MRQLFFIEGRLLGEAPRSLITIHGTFQRPRSCLFFCTSCGEVYAKLPVLLPSGATTHWQSYAHRCSKCSANAFTPPGSILLPWDEDFLAALPPAVLEREFRLHLSFYAGD